MNPDVWSNLSIAFNNPMFPSLIKSSNCIVFEVTETEYFLATLTTNNRLCLNNLCFKASLPVSR